MATVAELNSGHMPDWCPGCGDHAVLNAVQRALAELGIPKEKFAFISGIGCSSRFPYYMDTYGFHSIHGRASAIATGVKTANPDVIFHLAALSPVRREISGASCPSPPLHDIRRR